MKKSIICSLVLASFAPSGFAQGIYSGMVLNTPESQLSSGVNLANRNLNVRAQDDFYQYANGGWLKTAQIPADKAQWLSLIHISEPTRPCH
jgi:putative endopeptidase